mgnify:CR=1 FL=1
MPEALTQRAYVILSPHAASATQENWLAMGVLVLQNLNVHAQGWPLITPVWRRPYACFVVPTCGPLSFKER